MSKSGQEPIVFFDVDGTVDPRDTGQETLVNAGICSHDEFGDIMKQFHAPGKDEPEEGRGNELMLFLDGNDNNEELEEAARDLEPKPRKGMEAVIEDLSGDYELVAHSAGWEPAINAVTNGHFDGKIAGDVTDEGPRFNGRYQKPVRMQNYLVEQGLDPVEGSVELVYVGDSNTDLEAIRYADATGGYGIAIGESPSEALEVDEATLYAVDDEDHEFTSALMHYLVGGDIEDTRRYVQENGLDVSTGYAIPGGLAEDTDEIHDAVCEVRDLDYE